MTDRTPQTPAERGGCLCGAIRYCLRGEPAVVDCHCRRCQRTSGAAFVTWLCVDAAAFVWTAGNPSCHPSPEGSRRHFCAACGSTLALEYPALREIAVALGSLDSPGRFRATESIWESERIGASQGALPGAARYAGDASSDAGLSQRRDDDPAGRKREMQE